MVLVLRLVAGGDLHVSHALLALHVAAPVELAPAPLRPPLPPGGVAPVAAQQVATVDSLRLLKEEYRFSFKSSRKNETFRRNLGINLPGLCSYRVAFSAGCAETSLLDVVLAVVRGGHQVHQVRVAVLLEPRELRHQHSSSVLPLLLHFMSSIKLLLQHGSDLKTEMMMKWRLQKILQHKMDPFNLVSAA